MHGSAGFAALNPPYALKPTKTACVDPPIDAHRAAMSLVAAKIVWGLGCVAWYLIRYPHERRARKTPVAQRRDRGINIVLMTISFAGLFLVPFIYVLTGEPAFANYPFRPLQAWLGTLVLVGALALFWRTHHDLGRAWSVTLEVREQH